jgi:MinD-like ATPase involved in chromosome partitioning or flagellar assembly
VLCVLMVASGAAWEPAAFGRLTGRPDVVVLKRCVDVDDLLATSAAGQADVAVVATDAVGLDAAAVELLHRHQVRLVAVAPDLDAPDLRLRAARAGVSTLVAADDLDALVAAVTDPLTGLDADGGPEDEAPDRDDRAAPVGDGRVVVVWGPQGAPGRTTVAVTAAAVLAGRGGRAVLVDADPYGGAVAAQLGVTDEMSGLLAAARLATAGMLDDRFAGVQRTVGPGLHVVTGLPRPDRWAEVRPAAVEHLLEVARRRAHVVVDVGFSLEQEGGADFTGRPGRNAMTLGSLEAADEVVVVGAADPVGLTRLARGLVDLRELLGGRPVHVAVNRSRPSLGWSEHEVADMVEGFAKVASLHFLPEDRIAVDRALVAGRTLLEQGDSALVQAVAGLVDAVFPGDAPSRGGRRVRRRTTGRARRR